MPPKKRPVLNNLSFSTPSVSREKKVFCKLFVFSISEFCNKRDGKVIIFSMKWFMVSMRTPELKTSDGPTGVRVSRSVVCFTPVLS